VVYLRFLFILQQVKYPQAKYSKIQINFICRKPAPFCPAGHGTSVWPELLLLMPDFKAEPVLQAPVTKGYINNASPWY
jgi:hypothetical protein